jgi:hypothetical protein
MRMCKDYGVRVLAICARCQEERRDPALWHERDPQTGEMLLVCQCRRRLLEGIEIPAEVGK